MERETTHISDDNRRIARNTVMLYCRMLLLLVIGLYTSRVVLRQLGVDDYGVYNVVGGVVTIFTVVTGSVTQAIVRFLTVAIGKKDSLQVRKVFSASMIIQLILAALVVLLVETVGLWFLHTQMNIPPGRMHAAGIVLQCSTAILVLNMLSIPYNACITAHENMSVFAGISVLEGALKLLLALLLSLSAFDKLVTYAALMVAVALIIRICYASYCRRHYSHVVSFERPDKALFKNMFSFSGWNFLGSGTYLVNTHGINLLSNLFFGVAVNAARGVASQVESIVKQFVSNFLTAINPQITKSYACGDSEKSFTLVLKGSKFTFGVIWFCTLPVIFEAETILGLWLVNPPEGAALFLRLTLIGLLADMFTNPLLTLTLATGKIRSYYLITSIISLMAFPLSWILFRMGFPAWTSYLVFIVVYVGVDVARIIICNRLCGFPVKSFLSLAGSAAAVAAISLFFAAAIWYSLDAGWMRFVLTIAVGTVASLVFSWLLLLTPGEKSFIKSKLPCR